MTSGMVALVPSGADAAKMAVEGGEDPDRLHVTLAYLGDHATDMPPEARSSLHQNMAHLAAEMPAIAGRVAGHLLFNPDGGPDGDRTPCAAYLVSDAPGLAPMQAAVAAGANELNPDVEQHTPWVPHITGAYNRDAGALHYAGPVNLDTLRVAIGDDHTDYPLTGSDEPEDGDETDAPDGASGTDSENVGTEGEKPAEAKLKETAVSLNSGSDNASHREYSDPEHRDPLEGKSMGNSDAEGSGEPAVTISPAELAAAYDDLTAEFKAADPPGKGDSGSGGSGPGASNCLPDGSYQINHPGQLKTAVNALTAHKVDKSKRAVLRRHVIKHAKRLGATNMVPASVMDEKDGDSDAKPGAAKQTKDITGADTTGADTTDPADPTIEVKKVVASQAGVARYHKPIGTQLGTPRDADAAKAQQNKDAVGAYQSLLSGNTKAVAPLGTMDTGDLEDLTRVAYSYKSTDPKVVALRIRLANELAKRGLKATNYGALGGGKVTGHGKKKVATTKTGLPAGVRAPHQEGKSTAIDVAELEYKSTYTAQQRADMAKKGQALSDGSYPIKTKADLHSAIGLRNHGKGYAKATVHKHITRRAKALGATDMLPDDMTESKGLSWDGTGDAFTAGVLLGLAGLEPGEALEMKAGPPGHTFASPDPGAAKLRRYWTKGKGALKIQWGVPHDFDRCVGFLTKFVGARAKGLCNIYHRAALGVAPGQEDKVGGVAKKVAALAGKSIALPGELEFKSATQLWLPDEGAVDGWRAHAPAWEADLALIEEMKALSPLAPADDEEEEDGQPNTDGDQQPSSDEDTLAALDSYAAMVPQLSEEEAYEQGIAADTPWMLEAQGDLTDPEGGTQALDDDVVTPQETLDSDDSGMNVDGSDNIPATDQPGDLGETLFPDDEGDGEQGADPDADFDASQDSDPDPDAEQGDGSGDGQDAPGGIPEVAELLAALMADEEDAGDAVNAPPSDDGDYGEAQEDEAATRTRRAPVNA